MTWMKWLLLVVAVLAVVVAVVALVGMTVPQSHVATRSARFDAPPPVIWRAITDIDAFPAWRPDVKAVERVSSGPAGPSWVEIGPSGARLPLETVEAVPPRRLVGRIGPGLPFGGTWTYEIEPSGNGSRLTITERGEIYNPIFRFMARYVFGYTSTMETYLEALGKELL